MPKIGIRPTIDGRLGGVRESLEGQTMGMAEAAAGFLERTCAIPTGCRSSASSPIPASAAWPKRPQCADKFAEKAWAVSLTVTPCWCYGSETMDMDPLIPKAVWGFNGTERPGAVYLAAVLAGHNQKGPARLWHLRPRRAGLQRHHHSRRRAGKAAAVRQGGPGRGQMRGKSYLSLGGVSMGIAGSIVDPVILRELSGHARRGGRHGGVRAPHRRGDLRSGRI